MVGIWKALLKPCIFPVKFESSEASATGSVLKKIKRKEFRDVLNKHLLPMFAGAKLGEFQKATSKQKLVATQQDLGNCYLLLKPSIGSTFRIQIHRSQPFEPLERKLVEYFIEECQTIFGQSEAFRSALLTTVATRVIAKLLFPLVPATLEECIRTFEGLASQTYEGHAIVSAIGVTGSNDYGTIPIDKVFAEDFSRVVANGIDSLFVSDRNGKLFNIAYLPPGKMSVLAPFRLSAIAEWSSKNQNVALILNRNGELLLLRGGHLQFAKRRGVWGYFPHSAMMKRLGRGANSSLRKALYESCIDISFARTGGCIAWLDRGKENRIAPEFVNKSDLLSLTKKAKTQLLSKTIRKKFQNLDRRLRQEILAMDGATILNHQGEIIATGAIVKVPSGSAGGGGRRAAAIALSKFGVGIKISSDGPIEAFRHQSELFQYK